LREIGRLAEAAAEYDRLLRQQTRPLPETYIERAEVLAAIGRPRDAIVGLDDGVTRLGEVVTLRLAAIDIAVRAGDFEGALDRIERLLRQAPNQVFWMTRRAEILEAGGRYDEARRAFASADAALPAARISAVRQLKERIDAGRKRLAPDDSRGENG
jgi:predicted Zn-dependent protease